MSLLRIHKCDGVTIPNQARFEVPLDKIKKAAKEGKPIKVDAQGNVNTEGSGTNVPEGTFHTLKH
jgi:hypothetical protein